MGLLASGLMCGASEIAQKVCNDALKECAGLQNVPQNRWLEALSDVNMSGKMQVSNHCAFEAFSSFSCISQAWATRQAQEASS